jgi:Ca2+-transporting ATPase
MVAFLAVWWSYGYAIADLQAVTPTLLAGSADASIAAIYQQASTFALATIVACQDGNVFACRSEWNSILRLGFFSNRLVWVGIAVEWMLILAVIFLPPLQRIFSTAPLSPWQWLALLACPPLLLAAEEWRKWSFRPDRRRSRTTLD